MKIKDRYGLKHVYQLTCNCDENQLMEDILSVSGQIYSYVEKIPIDKMAYTPNDYNLQDNNPVSGPDSALNFINAEKAWEFTKGDTAIHVGITDKDINVPWTHEDIQGKIIYWDTVSGANENFHGLFVSGCVAANTDNGVGKSGIGFNSTIMFSSHYGFGVKPDSIKFEMVKRGVKVMNFSWGGPGNPSSTNQDVINTLNDNGVLVVAAAGNDYEPQFGGFGYHFYPASYKNVLSVASIDYNYHFVTWDPNIAYQHHNYNDSVDICAPGYHVMGLWDYCDTCYKRSSGSSFASPIVAGTAALIFSVNPCLSPATVTQILKSTANDTIYEIPENDTLQGKLGTGALDAGKALELTDRLYRPGNYSITDGQDTIWRDNVYVDSILTIEHGGQLTIAGTVFLNPKARISVHCGGKLVLDGGKLTTNCSCSLWDGIELWGNSDESQYTDEAQGTVELKNEAIIENANIGVKVFGDPYRSQVYPSGGILRASNTTFRNNKTAVRFYPYENYNPITHAVMNNLSGFTSCTFETTQELNDTISVPLDMVYFDVIRGIHFAGCTFQNTRDNSVPKESRGNGIFSIGSSFWIDRICLAYNQNECIREQRSIFSKLNYGIKALGTDAEKLVSVDRSVFTNNYTGMYLANIENAIVTRDTFYVRPAYQSSDDTVGGLYLNECHNYTVEENYLYSSYSPGGFQTSKSVGIAVNNSNLGVYLNTDNKIYNNRFEKLNYGVLPMNKNRNTDGDNGLEIRCNDFIYPNEYDIAVTIDPPSANMGIKASQGNHGNDTKDPAGNTFSYTHQNSVSDYLNEGEDIEYWYHLNNNGYYIEPINHSPVPIVYPKANTQTPVTYIKTSSCLSSFGSGGGIGIEELLAGKSAAQSGIDSVNSLLTLLVDGGDTPGTESYVESSTSDQTLEVMNDLLSKSPYLSDSVMITAAVKEDVLPPAVITEILSANPQSAKSDSVIQILENRVTPLTEEQFETIGEGLFVTGAKEALETSLSGYRSKYNSALKQIIQYYKTDTLNPAAPDSVISFLNAENQLWAKYALAFEYIVKWDTLSADNILNSIPDAFQLNSSDLDEHERYQSFLGLVKHLKRDRKSIFDADSLEIGLIENLLINSTGSLGGYARNILSAREDIIYNEPYIFPHEGMKSSKVHHKTPDGISELNILKTYPNPAKEYIIVEYSLSAGPDNASVIICNTSGKTIREIILSKSHDWLVLPLTTVPAGNYIVVLKNGSTPVKTVKFVVIK